MSAVRRGSRIAKRIRRLKIVRRAVQQQAQALKRLRGPGVGQLAGAGVACGGVGGAVVFGESVGFVFVETQLPGLPGFAQSTQAQLGHHAAAGFVLPLVVAVELRGQRQIQEAVGVAVGAVTEVVGVQQEQGAPFLIEAGSGVEVVVHLAQVVHVGVQQEPLGRVGLLEAHVHLPRNGLVAVHHRAAALDNFDVVNPGPGQVAQAVGRREPAQRRLVVDGEQRIGPVQPQELNLLGARHGIGGRNLHRRVGLKAFGQVAAGRFGQVAGADKLRVRGRQGRVGGAARGYGYFAQRLPGLQAHPQVGRAFGGHQQGVGAVAQRTDY